MIFVLDKSVSIHDRIVLWEDFKKCYKIEENLNRGKEQKASFLEVSLSAVTFSISTHFLKRLDNNSFRPFSSLSLSHGISLLTRENSLKIVLFKRVL